MCFIDSSNLRPSASLTTETKPDSISFLKSLQIIFTSPQMIMLLLFCGLSVGGIQAYNNNVTYMMTVLEFKQSIGGLVSSFATTSAVVGAVLLPLAQKTCFKKKDKFFYLIVFIICDVVYTLLLLTMPVPESWIKKKHEYQSIIKPSLPLIFITSIFAGIFVCMSYPLFFETAAEISFPVNEIVSGASITLATTVTYFVALLTFSAVKAEYTTLVALCLCVLGSILIPFLKVSYKRSEMEDLEREKESDQKQIQESQRGQKSMYGYSQAKIDE
ncbi:MAG: hypothetical protein EZS28_026659 [Streblomastix strix]|uniref:Uncharacterized protein n=1 Tax=Streblomastix strix TaxID=222440 RepID=A0A5J4V604_9EUKA|nr:MAG: hypothetical protein EZS28_026659 [Streblomastix strix]